jgi:hypothetical protein
VKRCFVVPTARSDSRCGERCVEGVDLDEPLLEGIEQWGISVDAAVIYRRCARWLPTTGGSSIDGRKTVADQLRDYADVRAAGRLARILARPRRGRTVTFVKDRGEGQTFERQWQRSIVRTVA